MTAIRAAVALIAWTLIATPTAYAATGNAGSLDGSTEALIMGPTGIPTPNPAYLNTVDSLYLQPNGFDGTAIALTTPETSNFGASITQGESDLVNAVISGYDTGNFSASDPLTIMGYSQSSVIASLAEQQLHDAGIPTDALRFVMLGDPASAQGGLLNTLGDTAAGKEILDALGYSNLVGATTPDNLYPTDVYTINGDGLAQWDNGANLLGMFSTHGAYPGLTPEMIAGATQTADGLTTYFDIPAPPDLLETLWTALINMG
jgi:hypothetical protein